MTPAVSTSSGILDAANLEWSKLRSDRPIAATALPADADHRFLVDHRVQGLPDSTLDRCYPAQGLRHSWSSPGV